MPVCRLSVLLVGDSRSTWASRTGLLQSFCACDSYYESRYRSVGVPCYICLSRCHYINCCPRCTCAVYNAWAVFLTHRTSPDYAASQMFAICRDAFLGREVLKLDATHILCMTTPWISFVIACSVTANMKTWACFCCWHYEARPGNSPGCYWLGLHGFNSRLKDVNNCIPG